MSFFDFIKYGVDLTKSAVTGVRDINNKVVNWGNKAREVVNTDATKLGIEKYLNDNYDPVQRRIVLVNTIDNILYLHLESEVKDPLYIYNESEGQDPLYIYNESGDPYYNNFIVQVPATLIVGDVTVNLIESEVKRFAFSNMIFQIELI